VPRTVAPRLTQPIGATQEQDLSPYAKVSYALQARGNRRKIGAGLNNLTPLDPWAARRNTWLLNEMMPKGVVFSFFFFFFFCFLFFSNLKQAGPVQGFWRLTRPWAAAALTVSSVAAPAWCPS